MVLIKSKSPLLITILLVLLLYACMCALVYWGRNRGICITDESFYLMLCRQPDHFVDTLSYWHPFASRLPQLSEHIVSNYRLWHLFVQMIASAFLAGAFALAVRKWVAVPPGIFLALAVAIAGIASLLPFSFFPLSLSYNSFVSFFVYLAVSCLLVSISLRREDRRNQLALFLFALAGVFTAFCFFVKPTSAIAFFALSSLLIFLVERSRHAWLFVGAKILGLIAGAAIFFLVFLPAPVWIGNTSGAFSSMGPSEKGMLSVVFESIRDSCAPAAMVLARTIAVGVLVYLISSIVKGPRSPLPNLVAGSASLLVLAQVFLFQEFRQGLQSVTIFYVIACLLYMFLLVNFSATKPSEILSARKVDLECTFIGLYLGLLPFACSFGTGNSLFGHTANHIAPVFLIILLLAVLVWQQEKRVLLSASALVLLLLISSFQFFKGYLMTPYGLALPLKDQDQATSLPGIKGQKICYGGRVFLERVYELLVGGGFKEGDNILVFYNMPGILLSARGTAPGLPSYFPEPHQSGLVARAVRRLVPGQRIFIVQTWTLPTEIKAELKANGYDFPSKFRFLGSLLNPYGDPSSSRKFADKQYLDLKVNIYVSDLKTQE